MLNSRANLVETRKGVQDDTDSAYGRNESTKYGFLFEIGRLEQTLRSNVLPEKSPIAYGMNRKGACRLNPCPRGNIQNETQKTWLNTERFWELTRLSTENNKVD